ncbi:MAG TPA: hypothetical protein VGU20_10530 [Stellaceae bacterium]|nr:hypothetical protein [Stellaceae bacterium]
MAAQKRRFDTRPPAPRQLIAFLQEIFPNFGDDDVIREAESSDNGLHAVMRAFAGYLSARRTEPAAHQLRSLGHLLDEAVALDDRLEEAVSTCLLEHLRQIDHYKALAPYLSPRAKARTRA